MTVTQRVNLVRNAEEHIRALTAVIDFLVQSPIFGSDDQLVKFLKDGTIAALVVQDPFRMGYDGVKIALAAQPASCDESDRGRSGRAPRHAGPQGGDREPGQRRRRIL